MASCEGGTAWDQETIRRHYRFPGQDSRKRSDSLAKSHGKYNVGDTVTVRILRDGQRQEIPVTWRQPFEPIPHSKGKRLIPHFPAFGSSERG